MELFLLLTLLLQCGTGFGKSTRSNNDTSVNTKHAGLSTWSDKTDNFLTTTNVFNTTITLSHQDALTSSQTEEQENTPKRIILGVILTLGVCVIILGNLLVITSIATFHELQTITNMFVASLACADLIMGVIVIPIGVPYVVTHKWMIGEFACKMWVSIDVLSVTASIETLCAVALDRYVAITKPFSYAIMISKSRARMAIGLIWITSASIAFIPVHLDLWKDKNTTCTGEYSCNYCPNATYAVLSSILSFYIPLVIMIFSYIVVFKEAIRHASAIDNHKGIYRRASMPGSNKPLWNRHQRRTVFTMGYIMGTFTICWLPFFIVNIIRPMCGGDCITEAVFSTLNWLGYFNSFLNPLIYCHSNQFRNAFKRIILCYACLDGIAQTKRASLTRPYSRSYRSSSSRAGSTLHQITSFFLSGGASSSSLRRNQRTTVSNGTSTEYSLPSMSERGSSPNHSPNQLNLPLFDMGSIGDSSDENRNNLKMENNNNEYTTQEPSSITPDRDVSDDTDVNHSSTLYDENSVLLVGNDKMSKDKLEILVPSRRYSENCSTKPTTTRRASLSVTEYERNFCDKHGNKTQKNKSRVRSLSLYPTPYKTTLLNQSSSEN